MFWRDEILGRFFLFIIYIVFNKIMNTLINISSTYIQPTTQFLTLPNTYTINFDQLSVPSTASTGTISILPFVQNITP